MPGRPNFAYQWRLASGSQVWRLNQLGRLRVVDDAVCLSASEAKALIDDPPGAIWVDCKD
jgi:hypothetical protein